MTTETNTKLISETISRRVAVMARVEPGQPWRQVESANTMRDALVYSAQLDADPRCRAEVIYEWRNEVWLDDAPQDDPNAVG